MQEGDAGLSPGSGRSPREGNGNPLQYFCLGNTMDRGAWRAAIHGVTKSRTQLSDWACTCRNTYTYVIRYMYSYTIIPPYPWTLNLQIQRASYYTIYTTHKGQLSITVCVWKMQEFGLILCYFSCVWLSATLWTVAYQVPLFLGSSRQKYWCGLPFPTPGDLPNSGIKPQSVMAPALAGMFFITSDLGSLYHHHNTFFVLRTVGASR